MKILFLSNLYPPYVVGGYEMLACDVAQALRMRGHKIWVATGQGKAFEERDEVRGVFGLDLDRKEETVLGGEKSILHTFSRHLFNLHNYLETWRLLESLKPDLVSVWSLYLLSISPLTAIRGKGVPCVVHLCDRWLLYYTKKIRSLFDPPGWAISQTLALVENLLQPILYRTSLPPVLVVPSLALRDEYLAHGFPAEIFVRLPHGIPVSQFPFQRQADRSDPIRLLYVGQLWEGKGPQILLQALGLLAREHRVPFHLDIYGDGVAHFKRYLGQLIDHEGLGANVAFCGTVPRHDLPAIYQSHDIFIFPSIWFEPFALAVLEAMCSGMAIVATSSGGTAEAIRDGDTGLLVPPGDVHALAAAILRLTEDADLRQRLGARAAQVARESYDFDNYVGQIDQLYHRIGTVQE